MLRAACVIAACAALLVGCASNGAGDPAETPGEGTPQGREHPDQPKRAEPEPAPSPPRNEKTVRFGIVDSVRPMTLPGRDSGMGATVGAVVGGIAGAEAGQGRGSAAGAVIGTVAGSIAGSALEDHLTRRDALEIIVELDTGELRAIVQEVGTETFKPGQRVRLLTYRGTTHVEKVPEN